VKTGRDDLDHRLHLSSIPAEEPTFFLRGRDSEASATLRAYAALIAKAGADPAVVEQALQQADRMDAYPEKRLVNAGHLTEAERKNLAAELARRAWNWALEAVPSEREFLAYQIGRHDMTGRLHAARAQIDAAIDALTGEKPDIARALQILDRARDATKGER